MNFKVKNKNINLFACKGQNGSSSSTVFEYLVKENSKKDIIILMDEVYDKNHPLETLTWIYESDFEFLKSDNIKNIIVVGNMYLQYKVRFLIGGIYEKTKFVKSIYEVSDLVDLESDTDVYILFEVDVRQDAIKIKDEIVKLGERK